LTGKLVNRKRCGRRKTIRKMSRFSEQIPNFAAVTRFGGYAPPAARANLCGVFHSCVYFLRKDVYLIRKVSTKSGNRVSTISGNR
ncbi:MAG: hypothetical protein J5734_03965, partial [Prevotella sp.]|nr:hypothetical protein [Prevotella sp.]